MNIDSSFIEQVDPTVLIQVLMTSQFLSELVEASVLEKVKKECRNLCDPKVKSVLCQTHATALQKFSWDTLLKEWHQHF